MVSASYWLPSPASLLPSFIELKPLPVTPRLLGSTEPLNVQVTFINHAP